MQILTLKVYPKLCSRYIEEQELYVSGYSHVIILFLGVYCDFYQVLRSLSYQYFAKTNNGVLSKNYWNLKKAKKKAYNVLEYFTKYTVKEFICRIMISYKTN